MYDNKEKINEHEEDLDDLLNEDDDAACEGQEGFDLEAFAGRVGQGGGENGLYAH